MRKLILVVLVFLYILFLPYAVFADTNVVRLTLDDAVDLAVKNSPDIKNADLAIEQARVNRDATTEVANAAAARAQTAYVMAPYQSSTDALVSAGNSMIRTAQQGRDAYADSIENKNIIIEKVKYNTEEQYFAIININNSIKLQEASLNEIRQSVVTERIKHQIGMSTALMVQQQENKALDAGVILDNLYKSKDMMLTNFRRELGISQDKGLELSSIELKPVAVNKNNDTEKLALDASLLLQQLNRSIQYKKDDIAALRGTNLELDQYAVGANITEQQVIDSKYNIKVAVKNVLNRIDTGLQTLTYNRVKYDTVQADAQAIKIQYQLGMISKNQLNLFQISYDQAKNAYEKSVYDYYLATRQLELAQKSIFVSTAAY